MSKWVLRRAGQIWSANNTQQLSDDGARDEMKALIDAVKSDYPKTEK